MGLSQSRNAAASHPISDTADRRASFECGKLCCPEEIRSPPKPETVANPTESSGDEVRVAPTLPACASNNAAAPHPARSALGIFHQRTPRTHLIALHSAGRAQEVESFEGWRSQPTSSGRPSEDLQAGGMSSPKSSQPSGSQGGPSSSEWLGQRPSADTPLPRTSGATKTQRGSASLDARTPRASAQYSNRTSTSTSSGADAQQQQVSSPAASARSSFALERAGAEVNRASLEAFPEECRAPDAGGSGGAGGSGSSGDGAQQQQAYASLELAGAGVTVETVARLAGVPPALSGRFAALCVLPPQTPAPLSALARLWGTDEAEAGATLAALADSAAVNVARLPSGELWALPQAQQLQLLQTACRAAAPGQHARLLDAYVAAAPAAPAPGAAGAADGRAGDRAAAARLRAVPDDGYFLANVGHHLLGAGRAGAARELLLDPGWLAQKLAGCGAAAVVADFRRFLMARPDKDVKLVLEAFQLSVAQAQAHPLVAGLLRCLVAARLMTAPLSAGAAGWPAAQRAAVRADGAAAAARGAPRALPPLTPSLDQAGGLQRLALRGHAGAVTRVLLTPSGTDAVTASADGTARVWDLEIGDCVLTLGGHTGAVTAMGLTADGSLLVTASEDGTARAFEMERGQCLRVLAGHEGAVAALALDPAGRFAVTGGADATARVWDLASARALHVIRAPRPVTALALSPCARFLVLGCADGSARMHDVAGGQLMGAMAGHASWVTAVEFAPDGARCVTAAQDGTARVWDLKTGACRHVLEGHAGRVNALALSGDGRAAATGSDDGTARLWDLRSGACSRVLAGHRGWVGAVALSPGGDRLVTASGDATAVAWDTDTGEAVRVLEGHSGAVLAAAVTRRGRFAVTASEDGTARAWDFAAPAAAAPRWHEGRVRALAARDGVVAATAGDDCVVRLWDARSGEYRGLLRGHATPIRWAAFSADGARLVTASPDRSVMVWDCQTAECLRRMPGEQGGSGGRHSLGAGGVGSGVA
jgi:WD40 repeat protein